MVYLTPRVISVLSLALLAHCATYSRTANIVGSGFNSAFSYQAIADPTDGRVNYVNAATAAADNLTYASSNTFILRADHTTTLSASGPGRNSVRLMSNAQYTTSVLIFDATHFPVGCGTWPAIWTVGADWPNEGEIDIVEGVNLQVANQATLHTGAGCTMPSRTELGTALSDDCNAADNDNSGCGVDFDVTSSYGAGFNSNGGGWYALERTNSGIRIWFWARGSSVPSDVSAGGTSVDTSNWGTPYAYFPSTDCDIATEFGPHNIIINLTFCGDWAGASSIYAASGCPSTCIDYVNDNPSAFVDAYFQFTSLNIYE